MKLVKVAYADLKAKQQEAYNFQKLSALLADYGLNTIRLSDDWQGADFIAQHCVTNEFIAVQLKGRFGFWKKYVGKNLWIAFRDGETWFLYDHDRVLRAVQESGHPLFASKPWQGEDGFYHFPYLPKGIRALLQPYIVGS